MDKNNNDNNNNYICVNKRSGIKKNNIKNENECMARGYMYLEETDWIDPAKGFYCRDEPNNEYYYSKKECTQKQMESENVKFSKYTPKILAEQSYKDVLDFNYQIDKESDRIESKKKIFWYAFITLYILIMIQMIFGYPQILHHFVNNQTMNKIMNFTNQYIIFLILYCSLMFFVVLYFCPFGSCQHQNLPNKINQFNDFLGD